MSRMDSPFLQSHNFLSAKLTERCPVECSGGPANLIKWVIPEMRRLAIGTRSDSFREVPLRYLGYGYALAEVFRYRLRESILYPFRFLAGSFILCHCLDRTLAASESGGGGADLLMTFCDTFLWEVLASVLFPTMITYCTVGITYGLLRLLGFERRSVLPFFVGMLTLPLFADAVDSMVDKLIFASELAK